MNRTKSLQLIDSRNGLDSTRWSYKNSNGYSPYAMDTVFEDSLEFDESRMSLWLPYVDGRRRDGVGDLLDINGIVLERHRKNPIVGFNHFKEVILPIAMAREDAHDPFSYTVSLDPSSQQGKLNAFFYQGKGIDIPNLDKKDEYNHALYCEQLYDMAIKGFIRGGSIGYQVIEATPIPPDYAKGIPQGMHLKRVLQLEGSLVVLPANMDTVYKYFCVGKSCGKSLSPVFKQSFPNYFYKKKAQLGYEGKAAPNRTTPTKGKKVVWHSGEPTEIQDIEADEDNPNKVGCYVCDGGLAAPENITPLEDIEGTPEHTARQERGRKLEEAKKRAGIKRIPPVKWKPGVGAIKALRKKYKGLREIGRAIGNSIPIAGAAINAAGLVHHAVSGNVPMSALHLAGLAGSIYTEHARRRDAQEDHEEQQAEQHASNPNYGGPLKKKSLHNIRQKYRSTKGLKRRLRKSISGSAMINVREKDLNEVQKVCSQKGIQADWRGLAKGVVKLKLTGLDSQIDDIAKKYGRSMTNKRNVVGKIGKKSSNKPTQEEMDAKIVKRADNQYKIDRIHPVINEHSVRRIRYEEARKKRNQ